MTSADGGQALAAFGQMLVDARDDAFDAVALILNEGAHDPVASLARGLLRTGGLDGESLREIVESYLDRLLVGLLHRVQDAHLEHGIRIALVDEGGVHDLAAISDGLAGELLTAQGWLATRSRHGRNALDVRGEADGRVDEAG